jgi:hypothetical protein
LRPSPEHERRFWLLAVVLLGVIYSTLSVARDVAEFLRERNLLRLSVLAVFALLGVAVLVWAVRQRLGPRGWGVLALGVAVFVWGVGAVSPVEVKLHFAEYGLLGGLVYLALCARRARAAPLVAIVLTGLAGWLDEGIQYLLPNRWYDTQDVLINAVAGAIAVLTLVLLGWAQSHRLPSR